MNRLNTNQALSMININAIFSFTMLKFNIKVLNFINIEYIMKNVFLYKETTKYASNYS